MNSFAAYFFTFPIFFFVLVSLATVVLVWIRFQQGSVYRKKLFLLGFGLVSFLALVTQWCYVNAPIRFFTNADHHLIEHLGFSFADELVLVDGQQPKTALWDNWSGSLRVGYQAEAKAFELRGRDVTQPVYVQENPAQYTLQNSLINRAIRQGFLIRFDSVAVRFHLQFASDSLSSFILEHPSGTYGPFLINLPMPLKKGYSLGGMLAKAQADAPDMGGIIAALDSAYLLRTTLETDVPADKDQSVVLFPSDQMLKTATELNIDGQAVELPTEARFRVALLPGQSFFFGLWSDAGKRYQLRRTNTGFSEWLVNFPQKEYLRSTPEADGFTSLFLTSSSAEVSQNEQLAGFYYPIFDQTGNLNHLSANLAYHTGPTRELMRFQVVNFDQNDLPLTTGEPLTVGDTLRLQTRGMSLGQNRTQWLFRITDLKANNPLQLWHMLLLTVLLMGGIYGCILLSPAQQHSKAEYLAYLLLLALMTLRSVLLWRVSTFLPVKDITPRIYNSLATLSWTYFWIGGAFCLAFLGLVMAWKTWGNRLLARFGEPQMPTVVSPRVLGWFGLYAVAMLIKTGSVFVAQFERIGAIFLPLLAFFVINFILLRAAQETDRQANGSTIRLLNWLNWLGCIGYLALSDAGFSIIFLVSSMLYGLIDYLTFPRDRAYFLLSHRLFLAGVVGAGLLLFIVLAPWALSLVFSHTQLLLYALAALGVLLAIRTLLSKRPWIVFQRVMPRWVRPAFWVAAAALLIGLRQPIAEQVQDKNYTRYRAEVLFRSPDEIIQEGEFQFNRGADSKLLRAAQNQWFINYFYQKGSLSPGQPFRVLPSFQKGSPYMTQICDLVTVRYVIGEHSQFVITFLLSLMALLLLAATDADTRYNVLSQVRVRLLCLLFAIGFFVWMAATNRIIFLGQDFPLLSLNSVLTFVVTLSILLGVIVLGDLANTQPESQRFVAAGQQSGNSFLRGLLLASLFGLLYVRQHDFSTERFNLDQTIENLQAAFDELNPSFRQFQNGLDATKAQPKPGDLLQQFDDSPYAPEQNAPILRQNPFALSAYKAHQKLLQQCNDPDNLIHLRRRNDDTYEFAVNKLFYSVSSPDIMLNSWRGHLLASADQPAATFVDRRTNRGIQLDQHRANANLLDTLRQLVGRETGNNLRLTYLPAGWTTDSLPLVLLSRTAGIQRVNQSAFVIKNGPDVYRSASSSFAVAIRPNDVLQFEPYEAREPITVQFQYQQQRYLAKNVWLNGHRQFFYPLEAKFLWPYHFASLVKTKFDADKKTNRDVLNQSVALSLDARLTETINDLAARYYRRDKWTQNSKTERARAFNLVVLGSDGKLRALCDFQKGAPFRIDPNRIATYNDQFSQLYLTAQTDQERLLFGNRCLLRMDNGPASTFKPILYSAVTSQYHFPWETLRFDGLSPAYQDSIMEKSDHKDFVIRWFGGKPIRFAVSAENLQPHGMNEYISQSTNTYNSMMVYLGSLNHSQIEQTHQFVLNRRGASNYLTRGYAQQARGNFPILNIGGTPYHLRSLTIDWSNPQSLLGLGLWSNFNLPMKAEQLDGQARPWQNPARALDSTLFNTSQSSNRIWSFPEASHFYLIDRNNLHNAIVQCATGADPINTTPYKMAEMTASLFSFNRAFQSTVLANAPLRYQPFITDPSWGSPRQLARFYSQTLFQAMHESTRTGTARNALGAPASYPAEFSPYYFYAKTGTISGNRDGGKRDKHLMLIISRDPLHSRDLTPDNLRKNRFVVLYFSFYKQSNGAEWGSADDQELLPTLREMIKAVINAQSVKALMHHEKPS